MNTQASILIQSLGWALLHSLWQGLLIYCCLRVILRLSGNTTARLRYHLSVAALAGSFVWFVNTCIAQYQRLQGITIQVTQSGADPINTKTYALTTLPTTSNGQMFNNIVSGIEPFFPVLVGLYIAGIVFLLLRLAVNLLQIRSLRSKGLTAADTYRNDWMQQWQEKLNISRKVQLFFSDRINVPMTIGAFKPLILLPIASLNNLSQDQLEAILLHELAHIKRYDYLLNILQTIVETILFFNPFVWLVSRIIRKEREHCCDDIVVSYFNMPLPYAQALAELEVSRHNNKLALAATGSKNQLFNRIKRIMEMKKKPVNYTQFGVAAVLILALIVSVAWFSPVMAQSKKTVKEKKGNKTSTTTVTTNKKGNKTISRTIVIDDKNNSRGVHPNDVGNKEDIEKRVQEALAEVDMDGIGIKIDEALSNVDWDGIGKNVQVAIANVDWDKIGDDATIAVSKVNWDEIEQRIAEARAQVKGVNWDEVEQQVQDARIIAKAGGGKSQHTVVMKSGNMTLTTDKITVADKDFNEMLEQMEDEGLINRSKGYNIEKDNDVLYIDGKKQPASVLKKYKDYLIGEQTTISGNNNSTSININK